MAEELTSSVVLGSDPEFAALAKDGEAIRANEMGIPVAAGSRYGSDGSGKPLELRPGVSESPLGAVARTYNALKEMSEGLSETFRKNRIAKTKAGSYAWPDMALGGHIHVGGLNKNKASFFGLWADNIALTWWLGIDDPEERSERWRYPGFGSVRYGTPSDIRFPSHGLEYRPLGSWLLHPAIALAAFSLTKIAAIQALENKRNPPEFLPDYHNDPQNKLAYPWAKDWPKYMEQLDPIIPDDCVEGLNAAMKLWSAGRQDTNVDILSAWGIERK